jgi:L-threonylcarbamoyladenylate synthase
VFDVKGRTGGLALPLIASDMPQVERHLGPLPPVAQRLAARFWPGPLSVVVPAPSTIALLVTGGTGTVAVRVPKHAVARALCVEAGMLLTATSANESGRPPTAEPDAVQQALGRRIDVLLDAGPTRGGEASTIVDVTGRTPRLLRAGAIPWDEIEASVRPE